MKPIILSHPTAPFPSLVAFEDIKGLLAYWHDRLDHGGYTEASSKSDADNVRAALYMSLLSIPADISEEARRDMPPHHKGLCISMLLAGVPAHILEDDMGRAYDAQAVDFELLGNGVPAYPFYGRAEYRTLNLWNPGYLTPYRRAFMLKHLEKYFSAERLVELKTPLYLGTLPNMAKIRGMALDVLGGMKYPSRDTLSGLCNLAWGSYSFALPGRVVSLFTGSEGMAWPFGDPAMQPDYNPDTWDCTKCPDRLAFLRRIVHYCDDPRKGLGNLPDYQRYLKERLMS